MTTPSVREAARALLDKLDVVRDATVGIYAVAAIHHAPYTGPTYKAEYDALRTALDADDGEYERAMSEARAYRTLLGAYASPYNQSLSFGQVMRDLGCSEPPLDAPVEIRLISPPKPVAPKPASESTTALDIETTCPKCHQPLAAHLGDEVECVCPATNTTSPASERCPRCPSEQRDVRNRVSFGAWGSETDNCAHEWHDAKPRDGGE